MKKRHTFLLPVSLVAGALVAAWLAMPLFLMPGLGRPLAASPADFGLAFETVAIRVGEPPLRLAGWWMPAAEARGTVLLVHDGGSNRSFLWTGALGLARALHDRGYHVLAPDLRGHGESEGGDAGPPLGHEIAPDLSRWVDEVEARAGEGPVVALGFGLGGQVALYAVADDPRIAAVVADSTWADLRSSMRISLPRVTSLPPALVRSLLWGAEHIHGIAFDQSRAVEVAPALAGRLFLIGNEEDPQIPARQIRWLSSAAGDAEVWMSPAPRPDHAAYADAGSWGMHTQSYRLYPDEYARRVDAFFGARLEAAEASRAGAALANTGVEAGGGAAVAWAR